MFWNEEKTKSETTETVVEDEEMDEFAQLESDEKEALKWAESFPDSNYIHKRAKNDKGRIRKIAKTAKTSV